MPDLLGGLIAGLGAVVGLGCLAWLIYARRWLVTRLLDSAAEGPGPTSLTLAIRMANAQVVAGIGLGLVLAETIRLLVVVVARVLGR